MSPPRLEARGLTKVYGGKAVVRDVGLVLAAGTIHGLLGPNGAGKSTVFGMIAGLVPPTAGEVYLDGVPLGRAPLHARARQGLALLPQDDTLFRDLTVGDNLALAIEVTGARTTPRDLLARVGLEGLERRAPATLSGGERRRVQIARLLALSPRVLLLDEPFAGVDPVAVADLSRVVRALAAEGAAVLLTDHAVREALLLCHRATVVDGGEVQVEGEPATVVADPRVRARYLGRDFVVPPLANPVREDYS